MEEFLNEIPKRILGNPPKKILDKVSSEIRGKIIGSETPEGLLAEIHGGISGNGAPVN